ncbi:MAG: phosphoenolpyruvate synthase [Actinobacteria bacterium]|nr:phosphoenolpyruvate synthase [Actinomycetota bacterium]
MTNDLIRLDQLGRGDLALAGGKAANLGELTRIEGVRVPPGFCVGTGAFRRFMMQSSVDELLDRLSRIRPGDRNEIVAVSGEIRSRIEQSTMPADLVASIRDVVGEVGEHSGWAVRSSATAEDLPTASFAGRHDTFLNVVGAGEIVDRVRRCWASLFTERAVAYRQRHGIDHRSVSIAVVLQQMVNLQASGVMFTADPLSCDRTVVAIEACFGLGEALVSGLVNPDVFKVRDSRIVDKTVASKDLAIIAVPSGGTRHQALDPKRRTQPALTDDEVLVLATLGRHIETHFGSPQDIEWCLVDNDFQIVQSRPITTLFPIPPANDDNNHVYVSVGHQQMMTDPMKPLGLSLWQLTTPAPMSEAGGRLFVDVTMRLATPASRAGLLDLFGKSDPLLRDALETVLDRGDFIPLPPDDAPPLPPAVTPAAPIDPDPAIVTELIANSRLSIATCKRDIADKSGTELFEFILADLQELRRLLFDSRSNQVFMTAMDATWWLNEHLLTWLGDKNVADIFTQSVPHNVTSEMGLALLDVADVIRPHTEVVAFLNGVTHDGFLDELDGLDGGPEVRAAIEGFLERYGMRCAGEIDITRPRWIEQPTTLLPLVLAHVENMEPGEAQRRFEQGRNDASAKEQEVLERLRALPDGDDKAAEAKHKIDCVRTFIGYREYPKYGMISRYFIYRQALLAEADRLVAQGVLREAEDIFFLRFQELHDLARTNHVDRQLIDQRREAFRSYRVLTPPRVLTSDGEAVEGTYRRSDAPNGALVGLAVSSGTIEGRARVITDIADADLEPGDILVTTYTDPSWTPLFVAITGLVTEVGGMMTHGAVIAREYGLPAVVGVERATEQIRDGQRIRLNGTDGYVIILPPNAR